MGRAKTLLRETFKAGTQVFSAAHDKEPHPKMPWVTTKHEVSQVDLLARGIVEKDGLRQEYIDVRMWTAPSQAKIKGVE
jgi:hypothetical protein